MKTSTLASAYLVACHQSLLADPVRQPLVVQPLIARPSAHLAPLPADSAHQTAPLLLQEAAAEAGLEVELEAEVLSQQLVAEDMRGWWWM